MTGPNSSEFPGLSRAEIQEYLEITSSEIGLDIADEYRASVLENLMALQEHAEIISRRLALIQDQTAQGPAP